MANKDNSISSSTLAPFYTLGMSFTKAKGAEETTPVVASVPKHNARSSYVEKIGSFMGPRSDCKLDRP